MRNSTIERMAALLCNFTFKYRDCSVFPSAKNDPFEVTYISIRTPTRRTPTLDLCEHHDPNRLYAAAFPLGLHGHSW